MPIRANEKIIGNAQLSLNTLVICRACRSPIAILHRKRDIWDDSRESFILTKVYYQVYSGEVQVYHLVQQSVECKIEGVGDEV
jgi:hypothetical protein